jgi:arabinose-5-phosphate isomerase
MDKYLQIAKKVFETESNAIKKLSDLLTKDFSKVVNLIYENKGRVVISGMGKSGHIGVKISATLASTGAPSFFLHPAEAYHGDLGMLTKDDVLIAISNSGETEEILKIIPIIKKMNIKLVALTGNVNSILAKEADYVLNIYVEKEACPLQLAPMASTTATLAMGDALAAALIIRRNFKPENFAFFHPGGSLGKKLLTQVKDIMIKDNLPLINENTEFKDILSTITKKKLGVGIVVDELNKLKGIITDGDLRRIIEKEKENVFKLKAKDFVSKNPKVINENEMAVKAKEYMLNNKIKELVVLDDNNKIVGIIELYDIENL